LFFQGVYLVSCASQPRAARRRAFHQQVGSLADEFYLLLKGLKELLVTWE
jgi:hypothetical protein